MKREKQCNTCGETKPLELFSRDSHAPDGRRYECKRCCKREWRAYADRKAGIQLVEGTIHGTSAREVPVYGFPTFP